MCMHVYSSIIHKGQTFIVANVHHFVDTNTTYLHNGILFTNKREKWHSWYDREKPW